MRLLRIVLALVPAGLSFTWRAPVAPQSVSDAVATEVISQERLAWEATKQKDKAGLARLLAADFTEITDDGVFDKAQVLANLDDLTLTAYSPRNFKAKRIAEGAVMLVYQVTVVGRYKGQEFRNENNAASLWVRRGGSWQNVHFQETPIPTP